MTGRAPHTRVVSMDMTKEFKAADFQKVYDECLSDIDISILVNNVGTVAFPDFVDLKD